MVVMRWRSCQVLPAVSEHRGLADAPRQLLVLLDEPAFEDGHREDVKADDDRADYAAKGHGHLLRDKAAEVTAFDSSNISLML